MVELVVPPLHTSSVVDPEVSTVAVEAGVAEAALEFGPTVTVFTTEVVPEEVRTLAVGTVRFTKL